MKRYDKFAFWHYDLFPYFLGAPAQVEKDGKISAKGYEGYYFTPCWVGSLEEGEALKQRLDLIENERKSVLETLEAGFNERLKNITVKFSKGEKDHAKSH